METSLTFSLSHAVASSKTKHSSNRPRETGAAKMWFQLKKQKDRKLRIFAVKTFDVGMHGIDPRALTPNSHNVTVATNLWNPFFFAATPVLQKFSLWFFAHLIRLSSCAWSVCSLRVQGVQWPKCVKWIRHFLYWQTVSEQRPWRTESSEKSIHKALSSTMD